MSLTTFLVRRLGGVALVILGITLVTFVTLHLFPADPARLLAGPGADEGQIRAIRQDLGLDRPLPVQYARYLRDLVHGNLGRSIQTGQPVADDLAKRLPATLELAAVTMVVYIGLSVPLGILAAVTRGRWPDLLIRLVAVGGLAVPPFWLGFLLQLVLYRELGWLQQAVGRIAPSLAPPPVRHRLLPRRRPARRRLAGPPERGCPADHAGDLPRGVAPGRRRQAHADEHAGGDRLRLRADGAGQGPRRAGGARAARAPERADARRHRVRRPARVPPRRHARGRGGVRLARDRPVRHRVDHRGRLSRRS